MLLRASPYFNRLGVGNRMMVTGGGGAVHTRVAEGIERLALSADGRARF